MSFATNSWKNSASDLSEIREPSDNPSSEATNEDIDMHQVLSAHQQPEALLIASYISNLKVVSPEVLRATSAGQALGRFGRAFRSTQMEDLFGRSWPTQRIGTFWSHSWHGRCSSKIMVLILSYNGPAAAILGTLAAVIMFALSACELLPTYTKGALIQQGNAEEVYNMAPWAHGAGCIVSVLVLFLWPAPGCVFLDRICIHQSDLQLKGQGILSIGGFIKNSENMMVVWDASYVHRLWCIFELAAFLKCQDDDSSKHLWVRPTFLGPCAVTLCASFAIGGSAHFFLVVDGGIYFRLLTVLGWLIIFGCVGHALRSHQRSIAEMLTQLKAFRVKDTKSYCCSLEHIDPTSQTMMTCDRRILMECVVQWFGSIESFDAEVQSKVRAALAQGLGNGGMPYLWGIAATCPLLWSQLDAIAGRLVAEKNEYAAEMAIYTMTAWLGIVPLVLPVAFALSKWFQRRRHSLVLDWGVSLVAATAVSLLIVLLYQLYLWAVMLAPIRLLGASIYALVLSAAGFLTWRYQSRMFAGVTPEGSAQNEAEAIGHSVFTADGAGNEVI